MDTNNPPLPTGYSRVPPGMLANVVICLEMLAKPPVKADPPGDSLRIERWENADPDGYRDLFRRIGEEWMWMSRLVMADEDLTAILHDPKVEIHTVMDGERRVGLLELDFRQDGECELAFFGLAPEAIGSGTGRKLMNAAIDKAWSKPIKRFWVHTCHFDHPAALAFYQRSGFTPYASYVEVDEDPRLTGQMRKDAAAHVPLIEPK